MDRASQPRNVLPDCPIQSFQQRGRDVFERNQLFVPEDDSPGYCDRATPLALFDDSPIAEPLIGYKLRLFGPTMLPGASEVDEKAENDRQHCRIWLISIARLQRLAVLEQAPGRVLDQVQGRLFGARARYEHFRRPINGRSDETRIEPLLRMAIAVERWKRGSNSHDPLLQFGGLPAERPPSLPGVSGSPGHAQTISSITNAKTGIVFHGSSPHEARLRHQY